MKIIVFFFLLTVCSGRWWSLKSRPPKVEHDCNFGIEKETVEGHKDQFSVYDRNGDGVLTAEEVVDASHRVAFKDGETYPVDIERAKKMIEEGDRDKDGTLTEKEWVEMLVNRFINSLGEDKLDRFVQDFHLLDKDGSHDLTFEELQYLVTKDKRFRKPGAFARALFDMYECNNDGKIGKREFLAFLLNREIVEERFGEGTLPL